MFKRKRVDFLISKLEVIANSLERSGLEELISYKTNTKKYIVSSFIGGVFRGLGISVGFTILGAIVIMILTKLASINLPLIGELIAEIVRMMEMKI